LVREPDELEGVDLPADLRVQPVDAIAEQERGRPVLPPVSPLQGPAEMAERGVEVALDRALPFRRPDGLDHLLAPRLETGGGGEKGEHLEGAPEAPVEIALPLLVPLPGDGAAQKAQDVDQRGSFGGALLLHRRPREDGRARGAAAAALPVERRGEQPRQTVPLRSFDPQPAVVENPPGLL